LALFFAVPHQAYINLNPNELIKTIGHPAAIIDCFGILSNDKNQALFPARL
jgi:hypothetical protein